MIEILVTFILVSLIILLFFKNVKLYFSNSELTKNVLQSHIDTFILKEKMDEQLTSKDKDDDGFIKFITESREYAFKYIEDSQETIKSFIVYFEKNIEHLKNNQPKDIKYKVIIKDLEEYYKKLKSLLPKDL